jgi:hypothetical protein
MCIPLRAVARWTAAIALSSAEARVEFPQRATFRAARAYDVRAPIFLRLTTPKEILN